MDYREVLNRELEMRQRRRPNYSMRAFARDLLVPAPKLSQILNGKCGISLDRARQLATRIELNPKERRLFVLMAEKAHARRASDRQRAALQIEKLDALDGIGPISLERFKVISDWSHSALLELPFLKHFESDLNWMAKRLSLPVKAVSEAFNRLVGFGLLKQNEQKQISRTDAFLAVPGGIPSREIRDHHVQILQKAQDALETVAVDERDFSTIMMAIDSSKLSEAKEKLQEFRREFCIDIQKSPEKDRLYCLSVQFFPIDKGASK